MLDDSEVLKVVMYEKHFFTAQFENGYYRVL